MKKEGKLIDNKEKRKQPTQAEPEIIQILELANKGFKVTMVEILRQ